MGPRLAPPVPAASRTWEFLSLSQLHRQLPQQGVLQGRRGERRPPAGSGVGLRPPESLPGLQPPSLGLLMALVWQRPCDMETRACVTLPLCRPAAWTPRGAPPQPASHHLRPELLPSSKPSPGGRGPSRGRAALAQCGPPCPLAPESLLSSVPTTRPCPCVCYTCWPPAPQSHLLPAGPAHQPRLPDPDLPVCGGCAVLSPARLPALPSVFSPGSSPSVPGRQRVSLDLRAHTLSSELILLYIILPCLTRLLKLT